MRNIGVDSLPLAAIVAAFIGGGHRVSDALPAVRRRAALGVGLISRQSIVLELGPLLTGLVLTGRVGARMTAEIGTMRVTEQIDALETLAYDPIAYLVVPRLIAALVMLPVLTILADARRRRHGDVHRGDGDRCHGGGLLPRDCGCRSRRSR